MSAQSEPVPETPLSAEQYADAVYSLAADLMMKGMASHDIERELVEKGVDAESAQIVVANLKEARAKARREAGKKNMLYGALWCVGGTVVTVGTLAAAAGGGSYVVAWGAIIFGAVQFFRGLAQSSSSE